MSLCRSSKSSAFWISYSSLSLTCSDCIRVEPYGFILIIQSQWALASGRGKVFCIFLRPCSFCILDPFHEAVSLCLSDVLGRHSYGDNGVSLCLAVMFISPLLSVRHRMPHLWAFASVRLACFFFLIFYVDSYSLCCSHVTKLWAFASPACWARIRIVTSVWAFASPLRLLRLYGV